MTSALVFFLFSLAGIGLVVGLTVITGLSRNLKLENPCQAKMLFLNDYPDFAVDEVIVADDNSSALFLGTDGADIGLIHAMGDRFVTRRIDRKSLREVREDAGTGSLQLHFRDFTYAAQEIPIADPNRLSGLKQKFDLLTSQHASP